MTRGRNVIGSRPNALEGDEDNSSSFDLQPHIDPDLQGHKRKRIAEIETQMGEALAERDARITVLEAELVQAREELHNRPDIAIDAALIPIESGIRALGRFTLTSRALISPDRVTDEELNLMLEFLKDVKGALQFWVGDVVLTCMKSEDDKDTLNWFERYFEIDHDTLLGWVRVCKRIDPTRRRVSLDFSHHAEVGNLKYELRERADEILDYCEKNALSVQELRAYIRSLTPPKIKPRPAAVLFSKDRIPRLALLKKNYLRARRGDKGAASEMKDTLRSYREWLDEIEKSLGLK